MLLNNPIDKYQLITHLPAHGQGGQLTTNPNSRPDEAKRRLKWLGKIIVLGAFQGPTQLLLSCRFLF
jgi:hypothetical protein